MDFLNFFLVICTILSIQFFKKNWSFAMQVENQSEFAHMFCLERVQWLFLHASTFLQQNDFWQIWTMIFSTSLCKTFCNMVVFHAEIGYKNSFYHLFRELENISQYKIRTKIFIQIQYQHCWYVVANRQRWRW